MRERYPGMRTKRCCEEASESSCLACCHSAERRFSLDSLESFDKCRTYDCDVVDVSSQFFSSGIKRRDCRAASFRNCFEAKIILPIVVTNVARQQSTAVICSFQDFGFWGVSKNNQNCLPWRCKFEASRFATLCVLSDGTRATTKCHNVLRSWAT